MKRQTSLRHIILPCERPSVFFAYSSRADNSVVAEVNRILADQFGHLDVQSWENLSKPGQISSEVVEAIRSSHYGLCYFSEPSANPEFEYQDNANVLFEAGMMHVLRGNKAGSLEGLARLLELASKLGRLASGMEGHGEGS